MAVKTPRVQVGISSDPNKNFVIDASQADGTLKISRGNIGNTTQGVFTISQSGVTSAPANPVVIARRAAYYQGTVNTDTILPFDTVEVDNTLAYNPSTGTFKPTTPGFYLITYCAVVSGGAPATRIFIAVFKNGVEYSRSSDAETPGATANGCAGSTLVYMNGVNDSLVVTFWANNTPTINGPNTRFTAHFVQG